MNQSELTMADVLRDPMIRQLLHADRVSPATFANLLKDVARKCKGLPDAAGKAQAEAIRLQ